tara:strand:+ start:88 stop:363 length:276 start_codon:yes stop_codon:yes gene_type:complete
MFETDGYDSREKVEAAREKVNAFWAVMAEFLTDESRIFGRRFRLRFQTINLSAPRTSLKRTDSSEKAFIVSVKVVAAYQNQPSHRLFVIDY